MKARKQRKTYYPTKEFDDKIGGLSALLETERWDFPGVPAAQIAADAVAQRIERSERDARRREYLALHETFGLAQYARYQRFMAVLEALRGIFRDDKAVMAKLKEFGREVGKPRKVTEEAAA